MSFITTTPTELSDAINYKEQVFLDGSGKKKVISYEKKKDNGSITKYKITTYINCVACGRDMNGSRFSDYHWCYNCFLKSQRKQEQEECDFCLISSDEE